MLSITHHEGNTTQNYLVTVRMAKISISGNNRFWWGCGERGTVLHCWWECKLLQPLWKTVWRFLKSLKIELPYDPAIVLLGLYPRNIKMLIGRGTCTPMFIATLSAIAKVWKEPKCPSTDEWIKKMWNTRQQWKKPKSCHLQQHGWNWRVLC